MTVHNPNWQEVLKAQIEKTSVTAVAKQIGYKRTSVSLALHGRYPGSTDNIAAAVLETFSGKISCPHLGTELKPSECEAFRDAPIPMSDPAALRHWNACQTCPFNLAAERVVSNA